MKYAVRLVLSRPQPVNQKTGLNYSVLFVLYGLHEELRNLTIKNCFLFEAFVGTKKVEFKTISVMKPSFL